MQNLHSAKGQATRSIEAMMSSNQLWQVCSFLSCLRVVIATVAFGMGLDSPNIRRIIHWGAPADTESYIQETGRAGRDGEQSLAKLYYAPLHPYMNVDNNYYYPLMVATIIHF